MFKKTLTFWSADAQLRYNISSRQPLALVQQNVVFMILSGHVFLGIFILLSLFKFLKYTLFLAGILELGIFYGILTFQRN